MKKALILILALVLSFSLFAMVACQQPCEVHTDTNHDGICDVCETEGLTVNHTDTNHDGKCDGGCGTTVEVNHTDAAHDGQCDVCGQTVEIVHVDANNDGICDVTACGNVEAWVDNLAAAKEYVNGLYLNADEITAVDYTITTVVAIAGVSYSVEWTITSDVADQTVAVLGEINSTTKQQTVNVDEFSTAEVSYKLVAKISDAAGHSVTAEYARKVPMFVVATYEDYLAHCKAGDGVSFTIKAYVIGAVSVTSSSKGSLYLQDADGNGYYAYAPTLPADVTASEEALDAYFPFGTEVCVTGTGTVYGGQYEFNKGCQVVKTGNVAGEGVLTFENATEVWGNAQSQGDHDTLMQDQNKLVVLEEAIFTKAEGSYYYFTVNGVQYNIYKTNYFMADQADIDALFAKFEVGKAATIKGIVSCYSNLYQIYPLDVECISNVHTPELNDAQKVAFEKGNLTLAETITVAGSIELPSAGGTYENVAITWALEETYDCATIAEGKLNITIPSKATKITVVATLTLNGETDIKVIEITVAGTTFEIINLASASELALAQEHNTYTADKYYIMGTVKDAPNSTYGNMYIVDAEGNELYVYGVYDATGANRYDAMANAPQAGEVVILYGVLGQFNGTAQMKNAWAVACYKTTSLTKANELASAQEHNTYTADKYYVMGTVKDAPNSTYGNMYIVDAEGNELYVYGVYDATGANRYDAMANAPQAGEVVILYGVLGQFNGTAQMKNAWAVVVAPAGEAPAAHTCESKCEVCGGCADAECTDAACATKCTAAKETHTLTVAEALTLGAAQTSYTTGKYYVTGVITEVSNTTYGNMYIADENGNTILIYGTYDATGANRYDAMANAPVAGDTVTIYGIVGQFNGTAQIKNGWIVEHTPAGSVTPPAHTCESVCPTCGKCTDEDCAETVCADKCPGHTPVVAETTYTLTVPAKGSSWSADTLINDIFYVSNGVKTESIKITGASYEADGLTFTNSQISLTGGKVQVSDGVWSNSIFFTVPAGQQAKVVVYAAQKSGKITSLKVMNADGQEVTVDDLMINGVAADAFTTLPTDSVAKYEFTLAEGTYHIGGAAGGAYVYGMTVTLSAAQTEEPVAVVINGVNYSEAQAEAALLALQAGDVVTILANATIAQEYTFVAANYTLGEGATLTIKANVVAPAGAKLTVSAGATIVVEAGAHIDISALTQDDFATSTSARLAIAAGAKVTMPAYAEALWNDAYLKVVIEAMVANSEVGAELVLGETELTKTANGWEAKATAEKGTQENPYTVAEAIVVANANGTTAPSAQQFVKAYIVEIVSYNSSYNNYELLLADEMGSTTTLKGYRVTLGSGVSSISVGDLVLVEGYLYCYSTTPQIQYSGSTNPTLTVVTAHVCEAWTNATCDAPAACTVCGKANGEALGHTEANAQGKCDRCGTDLQVAAASETVSLSFASTTNRTTYTTTQQVWTQNGITLTNDKGSSTSNVGDYSNPARFYKSSKITIAAPGQITKIVFDCNSSSYATALKDSIGTVAGATVSVSSDKVTVTFENPVDSFVIASLSGGQVRMDAMEVTYVPAE